MFFLYLQDLAEQVEIERTFLENNMDMIARDELTVLEQDEEMQSFLCRKRGHLFHSVDPVGVVIVSLLLTLDIFHTFTPAREAL